VKNARVDIAPTPLALGRRSTETLADFLALTKPRLNFLVVVTSAAGYYLGSNSIVAPLDLLAMARAVAGTALVAGSAAVLNQLYERDTDRLMRRTRMRPLPDGRVTTGEAQVFGLVLAGAGLAVLALGANLLPTSLALATLVTYLAIYTPMKRRSEMATLVGAVPGALPPLIGWAAARGSVTPGGLALFAIVFFWQIPHFMAIAWMYRDDYRKAGFPMLPVLEPDGLRTGRQAVLYSAVLLPVSLLPAFVGVTGIGYAVVAAVLGTALIWLAVRFAAGRSESAARALFFGSITYLPLIWAAMILNRK